MHRNTTGMMAAESFSIEKAALLNMLAVLSTMTFSQTVSAKVVGGRKRLRDLVVNGKIGMVEKPSATQCGKCHYNAAQVMMNCRCLKLQDQQRINLSQTLINAI